jgi:hypothetical protein
MAGNRLVQFGADPPRVVEGRPATVRARFTEAATALRESTIVAVRVLPAPPVDQNPETAVPPAEAPAALAVVRLQPSREQPRAYEAELPAGLPPGRYQIILAAPELEPAFEAEGGAPVASLEVTPRQTSELIELAASPDELERLAAATGGVALSETELDRLPALLKARTATRTYVDNSRLWDRPEALLWFVGLLTIEWVIRKRAGLP